MNPSLRPLLCRSPLYPNESLPSFLIRLALLNRYEYTPTQVMALCRQYLSVPDDMARPAKADTYRVLAALVGVEVQTLHAATVHRFAAVFTAPPYQPSTIRLTPGQNSPILENRVLGEHVWPETQTQFCPFCLKESSYHQLTWTPFVITLCLKHGCLLVQSCPDCQQMLNIRAVLQAKCLKCGFNLTEAPTKRIATNKFALFSQAVVQSWLGLGPAPVQTDYGLPDQPPLVLYHLLQGLHGVVANGAQHWQPRHRRNFSPAQRYRHYLAAFRGMVNWPQGFYDFLEHHQQNLKHRLVQPTYPRWFDTLWLAPAFQFVQDAFDKYLLDHYSPLFLLRLQRTRANFTFRLKLPCLSEADAAKLLNTSPVVLQRLVRTGYLAPYSTTEDETLAQHLNLVSHAEVLKLQQQWSQTVPVNDVAQLLGTTSVIIRNLVKGGVLDSGFPLSQEDRNPEGISWASLTTFTDSLQRTVRPHPATTLSLRTLQSVVQQVTASGASSALIIQRILGKELRSY